MQEAVHHVWGLPVALDLFFAGLGAGLFLVAVMADLFGDKRYEGTRRVGGILAPWPVLLGVLLLVVDLGKPLRFWEFVFRAGPGAIMWKASSVMSWGVWLLIIFVLISLCYCLLSLIRWPFACDEKVRQAIGIIGLPFALLVTIYTGVLIAGTSVALWNTAMLPLLFVGSAILAGLAAIIFWLSLRPLVGLVPSDESTMGTLLLGQAALSLVVLALSVIYVVVVAGREGGSVHLASSLWWVFVVILGLVLPLVYGIAQSKVKAALATPVVAGLAVIGAFFLRYTILINGQV